VVVQNRAVQQVVGGDRSWRWPLGLEPEQGIDKHFFGLAKKAVTERYETCRVLKPEGTRKSSTEIYVIGVGLRA